MPCAGSTTHIAGIARRGRANVRPVGGKKIRKKAALMRNNIARKRDPDRTAEAMASRNADDFFTAAFEE